MVSKNKALSSTYLLPKFVFIAIYHKYLQGMSFWCTWSSIKILTHLIIARQHSASCRTQAARCQTRICWKSFIWPSTCAVMMWKDQALSSPPLLPKFVFIAIYHKYLQCMSFWCTWSSLTHLIITGQHSDSYWTQATRCQTIAEHPTGQSLIKAETWGQCLVELELPDAKRS